MAPNLRLLQHRTLISAALVAMSPALTGATDGSADAEADVRIVNANDEPIQLSEHKTVAPFHRRLRRNAKEPGPAEPAKVAYGARQWTLGAGKTATISLKGANSPVYVFDLVSADGTKKAKLAIDTYGHQATLLDAMDVAELRGDEAEGKFEVSWKRPDRVEAPELPASTPKCQAPQTELSAGLDRKLRGARAANGWKNDWKPSLPDVQEAVRGFADTGELEGLKGPEPQAMPGLKTRMLADALRGSVAPSQSGLATMKRDRQASADRARMERARKQSQERRARKDEERRKALEAAEVPRTAPVQAEPQTINAEVLAMFGS
jgi:hypothetical protein